MSTNPGTEQLDSAACLALLREVSFGRLAVIVDDRLEVDGYDDATNQAWSVVVSGTAHEVQQLHEILEALELPVFPWEDGAKPHFVRIDPDSITSRRFTVHSGAQVPTGGPEQAQG